MWGCVGRRRACWASCARLRRSSSLAASAEAEKGDGRLKEADINEQLRAMQYAVRGEVPIAAAKIDKELRELKASGESNPYEFDHVLYCNIGNPQSVGQPPITFYRQVLALVDSPSLLAPEKRAALKGLFAEEEVLRAEELAREIPGGSGAYSDSQGIEIIRENVASFIEERDGYPSDPRNIFLANGASSAIQMLLTAAIAEPDHAVMIPIPQYPIYSALITLLNGQAEGYYLDEENQWALHEEELQKAYNSAVEKGHKPRAIVAINPGNPTGATLSYNDVSNVIKFCQRHQLVLLADEVYQENIYKQEERPFHSFKKVMCDLDLHIQLASFHSTSKGFIGECGRRGGYMELCNFDEAVKAQLIKLASSGLCSNTDGQIMTDLMVRPPSPGPSLVQFEAEREAILGSLKEKSDMVYRMLSDVPGVSCQPLYGAMYAFPKIELPDAFIRKAEKEGREPDTAYALSLLRHTGICSVPGNGFKQKPGTFHLRITFLPRPDALKTALERFKDHHVNVIMKC